MATICVVSLFQHRNFAVGVTFTKTDVIMTVFIGLLILDDQVSTMGMIAIVIGLVGVLLLSRTPGLKDAAWWEGLTSQATGLGVGAGLCFALSAVAYRAAAMQVADPVPVLRAAVALAFVTAFQFIGMAIWLALRDPAQLSAVWATRRTSALVGITSLAGSFCWFWAFALQGAAYVRAVGQVELIFSLLASTLFFHEKMTRRELLGIAILTLSILILVTLA
jgi:drug/metabolite transporter (DMT)-like permease